MVPAVTVPVGENSEKPLFSQTRISGSFHSAETLSASISTPWLAAPSPKKAIATAPLRSSWAAKAAPVDSPMPPPTMPLAPMMPLEKSATCIEPPRPRQIPVARP